MYGRQRQGRISYVRNLSENWDMAEKPLTSKYGPKDFISCTWSLYLHWFPSVGLMRLNSPSYLSFLLGDGEGILAFYLYQQSL